MTDVTPWVALVAGVAAFFSPCVLPVVPAFLGFVGGGADAKVSRAVRMLRTGAFVSGFGVAFAVLGFLIATIGSTLEYAVAEKWLRWVGGTLVIVFGLAMTGLLRFAWMDRDLRFHGKAPAWLGPTAGAAFLGAAFGVGWSPCVGPILSAILVQAGISGGGGQGAFLLGLFAVGLAIPFLAFGLVADQGASLLRRWGRAAHVIEVVGGILLILLGMVIFTNSANRLLTLW
ncbi:MAG: cytochrome c biogenesis CcdA family protein [Thermoplasmatota archaeon]